MKKNINRNTLVNKILMGLLFSLLWTGTQAAKPLWTIVPAPGSNPTQTVPENGVANVLYVVQNQSNKSKKLVMQPIPGIAQVTPCQLTPKGRAGDSCTLNLAITGSVLPDGGVHGGPILCQANFDNSPNPNQCYRPSDVNSLNIAPESVTTASITLNPSALNFVAGNNGLITITNNAGSAVAANNVSATIPGGSAISVQSSTCGVILAIGASCTITFTASVAEGPTNIAISGSNTNTANVEVSVTSVPMATIGVNPTTLLFEVNSIGSVTVTNNASSIVAANNISVTIPGGSAISVQSTTCGTSLAIGASCTITFTAGTQEGPTPLSIAGDNTNTVNANVTVTTQPILSITAPIQQSRVVEVLGASLSLVIHNDVASLFNANMITVNNKAACPNLSVDDSACTSVAPGATCTLLLTSNTPYAPCMITVGGSNTVGDPGTLIAFSYLGGLVFEESGGSGKIVNEINDISSWTTSFSNITGAVSLDDGATNTDAIVLDANCTTASNTCAALICRNISPDWYLPAINELTAIYGSLCSNSTFPCNFGDFIGMNKNYWSSSQVNNVAARNFTFEYGYQLQGAKNFGDRVRCIRYFP